MQPTIAPAITMDAERSTSSSSSSSSSSASSTYSSEDRSPTSKHSQSSASAGLELKIHDESPIATTLTAWLTAVLTSSLILLSSTPSTIFKLAVNLLHNVSQSISWCSTKMKSPKGSTSTSTGQINGNTPFTKGTSSSISITIPTPSGASLSIPTTSSPIVSRPRPIPNSYWATPLLLACEYPWTPYPKNPNRPPKLDSLLLAGVRTFIDLTECGELIPYTSILDERCKVLNIPRNEVEYYRFAIRDRSLPSSLTLMQDVMSTLYSQQTRNRISAVHCRGGIGRTGMVIGCWLVESGRVKDGKEALGVIAREWKTVEKCKRYPCSPETGDQFEYVVRFCPTNLSKRVTNNLLTGEMQVGLKGDPDVTLVSVPMKVDMKTMA